MIEYLLVLSWILVAASAWDNITFYSAMMALPESQRNKLKPGTLMLIRGGLFWVASAYLITYYFVWN